MTATDSFKPYGGSGNKLVVKNKAPNPIQITAEQLLREAVERQQNEVKVQRQIIVDEEELEEYRIRKRKEYEDSLRRQRHNIGIWIRYAEWEASQMDFRRARSIYERALTVDFCNIGVWTKYLEMETKNKFINSARNLYDRVTQLLPRVDQFWFKYAYMEELLGNYVGARNVFERWMEWNPDDKGWMMYVHFEERCKEIDLARTVFERYLANRPSKEAFLKFCKFEEKHRNVTRVRAGFEKAIEILPESSLDEDFFIKFAQFEERQKEFERVKYIYQSALEKYPKNQTEELSRRYVAFQKQRGDKDILEKTVIEKRRFYYESELLTDPRNYDTWFDLLKLEELIGDEDRIRDTHERCISNVPLIMEKQYWKRYIYVWINYALFEEIMAKNIDRTRAIYDKIIQIIPHNKFSFSKIWILYAEFEIRQLQLDRARLIYGRAIGQIRKPKIFKSYAALELGLGNIDRCRKIHAKFIEFHPMDSDSWISMIEFEILTEEIERARSLCEIAISYNCVDSVELIWKKYIDLECDIGEFGRAATLYERLLNQSKHFKVFKAYSSFQLEKCGSIVKARDIVKSGIDYCKMNNLNEERKFLIDLKLYQHWFSLEKVYGDKDSIDYVASLRPTAIRVKRTVLGPDGISEGYEEIIQYVFKDDDSQSSVMKILEKAKEWKKRQLESVATNNQNVLTATA